MSAFQPNEDGTLDPDWDYTKHEQNGRIRRDVEERCIACNRPVKDWQTKPVSSVHMTGRGLLVPADHPDSWEAPAGAWPDAWGDDMGWYTIGPECARKLPAAYVHVAADPGE